MTAPAEAPEFPAALDNDHDDVAWALQTAAVQWNRGGQSDALVWLRRAVDSAVEVGAYDRAGELTRITDALEAFVSSARVVQLHESAAEAPGSDAIDMLLSGELPSVEVGSYEYATQSLVDAVELASVDEPRASAVQSPVDDVDDVDEVDDEDLEELDDVELLDDEADEVSESDFAPNPFLVDVAPKPKPPPPRLPKLPPPPRPPVATAAPAKARSSAPAPRPSAAPSAPAASSESLNPFEHEEERTSSPAAQAYADSPANIEEATQRRSLPAETAPESSQPPPRPSRYSEEEESPTGIRPMPKLQEPAEEDRDVEEVADVASLPPQEADEEVANSDAVPQLADVLEGSEPPPPPPPEALASEPDAAASEPEAASAPDAVAPEPEAVASPDEEDDDDDAPAVVDEELSIGDESEPAAAVAAAPEEPAAVVSAAPEEPAAVVSAAPEEPAAPTGPSVLGQVDLAEVRGLEDLPPETQADLVARARIETLASEEEVSSFGLALVLKGSVAVMPAIADVASAFAGVADPVFCRGNLEEGVEMRIVAGAEGAEVAVWQVEDFENVMKTCPWVADELRDVADRFQALAGATMGPLGERLDDTMRSLVTDSCEVKRFEGGDVIVEAGTPLPGLHVVGAGRLEAEGGRELLPGELLFAQELLGGGTTPATVRAGAGGALVLFVDRMKTHELMMSVPPLLELLATS